MGGDCDETRTSKRIISKPEHWSCCLQKRVGNDDGVVVNSNGRAHFKGNHEPSG